MTLSEGEPPLSTEQTSNAEAGPRTSVHEPVAGIFGGVRVNNVVTLPSGEGALPVEDYFPWDDPEFERNPYPWFARAQEEVPVVRDEGGAYVVTRYDDIMEFGNHPAMSVEPGWDAAGAWSVAAQTIIGRDEPEHSRLRRQTNRWLSPKAVADLMPTTQRIATEIVGSLPSDTLDGWIDLALPVTHRTMCHVLQLPDGGASEVMHHMASTMPMLAARPRTGSDEMAVEGFRKLGERVDIFVADKRGTPGDGLADSLLEAVETGAMSEEERRATTLLLYSLGHMDVGYAIASGLNIFAELPEVFEDYRANPELRDGIINEIIRYDPPELNFYRTTLEDVLIRGVAISAGSRIKFVIAAANRDPRVFDDPQVFDHLRPPARSQILSFGMGTHGCIGQRLSRSQTRVIYDALAERFRRIELTGPVEMDNTDFSRHFVKLPLRLVA